MLPPFGMLKANFASSVRYSDRIHRSILWPMLTEKGQGDPERSWLTLTAVAEAEQPGSPDRSAMQESLRCELLLTSDGKGVSEKCLVRLAKCVKEMAHLRPRAYDQRLSDKTCINNPNTPCYPANGQAGSPGRQSLHFTDCLFFFCMPCFFIYSRWCCSYNQSLQNLCAELQIRSFSSISRNSDASAR